MDEWKKSMGEAFKLANEKIEKTADYNKRHYDKSAHEVEIGNGDRVLMKNVRERGGTGKLRSHWEHSMFEVTEKKADLPVYTITNINKKKDIRVVHRNLLMKANELPESLFQKEKKKKVELAAEKKKKVVAAGKKTVKFVEPVHVVREDDDDQDQEELVITYHNETPEFVEEEEEDEIIVNDQSLNDTDEEEDIVPDTEDVEEELEEEDSEEELVESEVSTREEDDDSAESVGSEDSENEEPVRKSTRVRNKPKVLTYDADGNTMYEER